MLENAGKGEKYWKNQGIFSVRKSGNYDKALFALCYVHFWNINRVVSL